MKKTTNDGDDDNIDNFYTSLSLSLLMSPILPSPLLCPRRFLPLVRCRRLFNIFHPYDPVAFRLEPLLRAGNGDGRGAEDGRGSPPEEPVILPTWTGGLRVHYQVQRWWQDIWSR